MAKHITAADHIRSFEKDDAVAGGMRAGM